MSAGRRDVAASVHARLANRAREMGADVGLTLVRYANERLLYRLAKAPDGEGFLLKGATRLQLDGGLPHRPTRDIDLMGHGEPGLESLAALFAGLCEEVHEDEGLLFDGGSVRAEPIREGNKYRGVRVCLVATLGRARLPLQIDIGFGDAVTPEPELRELPTLLDLPAPRMRVYPLEAVVAEKLQILVELGEINSRVKDYFDLHHLARTRAFRGDRLGPAIEHTFRRRETPLPIGVPVGLTQVYTGDPRRAAQWEALRRSGWLAGRSCPTAAPLPAAPAGIDRTRSALRRRLAARRSVAVGGRGPELRAKSSSANRPFYTSPTSARRGVASALHAAAERDLRARGVTKLTTEASLVARPFFERQGYAVALEQQVERRGLSFRRFAMEKRLDAAGPGSCSASPSDEGEADEPG